MITALAQASPHITIQAEPLFHIGPLTITNSMLLGLVATGSLVALLLYVRARARARRYNRLTVAVLWGYDTLLGTAREVLHSTEQARRLAPLAITMFFVIIVNNWFELLPFVGPIHWHGQPLFRGLAADLNFTLALAIITMLTAQIWAVKTHGLRHNLHRYFANPLKSPLHAFEGFLELIAEFSRLIALSMRLFGNIFGGEVLLVVISFIAGWLAPVALPAFMVLELFVGAVQAYVFFMLTVVFISLASGPAEPEEPDHPGGSQKQPALVAQNVS